MEWFMVKRFMVSMVIIKFWVLHRQALFDYLLDRRISGLCYMVIRFVVNKFMVISLMVNWLMVN